MTTSGKEKRLIRIEYQDNNKRTTYCPRTFNFASVLNLFGHDYKDKHIFSPVKNWFSRSKKIAQFQFHIHLHSASLKLKGILYKYLELECKDDTKMTQSCLHTSTTHLNVILQNISIHVLNEKNTTTRSFRIKNVLYFLLSLINNS